MSLVGLPLLLAHSLGGSTFTRHVSSRAFGVLCAASRVLGADAAPTMWLPQGQGDEFGRLASPSSSWSRWLCFHSPCLICAFGVLCAASRVLGADAAPTMWLPQGQGDEFGRLASPSSS